MLFFNYGHSMRQPHPTFVYTNLDPFYQDRSFFGDLGNPNLNPEVDISYELGFRNQITQNDALTLTAFWRDKFDFITVASVPVQDATGRSTNRALRVNGDFARVRGIEVSYIKRIADWFRGQINASYSRATGLASTNSEALPVLIQDGNIDNTFETPLAWDRPLDIKASTTFSWDRDQPLWGVPGLNRFQLYLASTFRSGQRYTPVEFIGNEVNPFTGVRDWRPIYETVDDPERRFSEVGKAWWWSDLNLQRRVAVAGTDLVFSLEITNVFNQQNAVLVNPVTGEGYPDIDAGTDFTTLRGNDAYDVPSNLRDPRYEDPNTSGPPALQSRPLPPAAPRPPRHQFRVLTGRPHALPPSPSSCSPPPPRRAPNSSPPSVKTGPGPRASSSSKCPSTPVARPSVGPSWRAPTTRARSSGTPHSLRAVAPRSVSRPPATSPT